LHKEACGSTAEPSVVPTELPLTHEFCGQGGKKGITLSETVPISNNMRLPTILLFGFSKHRLLLGLLLVAIPTLAQVPTGAASFVKTDTTTAGTWRSAYGADGYNLIGDLASVPAYVTATPFGNSSYVWASSTSDTRAPQKASNPADRIAACWYSSGSFTIDLAFHDSNPHQVAVYVVDLDNYNGRTEKVDVIDANNNVLDTRSVASFVPGEYLVWNLSGHVILRVTNTNPSSNAVVSGLFFGTGGSAPPPPPSPPTGAASFVKADTTTAGTWKSAYGADGFNVIGDSASVPAYATATPAGNSSYVWTSSTSDTRALQKASNPADRIAACWYSSGSFTIDLAFHDSNTHQVGVYVVDLDNYNGRTERVDVIDANNNVLDTRSVASFVPGEYLVWNLSGHVILRVTNTNPSSNAVVSGLFFGTGGSAPPPPPSPPTGGASFVRADTTTAGTWKSAYGADGFNVIGNSASVPAYVTATPAGNSSYVWASSTSDTRALQKASNLADRIAACWYSSGQFTIDLAFNDSNTHQVGVYVVDLDNYNGRTEKVDVIDANNNVLDTRTVASFVPGEYLVWNLSGHVILRVTNTNPSSNAVVSGLFFGTLQPTVSVSVSPSSVNLLAGGSQQFSTTVLGSANTNVTWSLSSPIGTISAAGLYAAPATLSSQQTVTVKTTSVADPTKFASATVTLNPPVNVTVAPPSVTLTQSQTQTFSATVTNTGNTAVTWSLSPVVGSITATGLYTAPASISSSQTVTVKATSVADPAKSATANVTLTPRVAVSLTPSSVSLLPSQNQTFTAIVSGTSNTAVTWSINPALGGLVSSATTAVYVAPSTAPTTQSVTITATSMADPSKTATAVITLLQAVIVSISPSRVSLTPSGTQQFTPTLSGASNTAVTWSINPSVGTISSAGLYTAPSSILTGQTVTVTARSVADPTKSASEVVSVQTTPSVSQWSMGFYKATDTPALPISAIQWAGLTHIIHSAFYVQPNGIGGIPEADIAAALVTAAHAHNAKVLVCLAADNVATDFDQAVENHLSTLVTNIMTVVNAYGYDGVDIDWEGEAFNGTKSGTNMINFAAALRTALGSKLLTADALEGDSTYWANAHTSFDRVNVMTYGFAAWADVPWFSTPLYDQGDLGTSLDKVKIQYIAAGVPAAKLNLGLGFYGKEYKGGVLDSDHSQGISGPRQVWQTGNAPTVTLINYNAVLPLITQQNYHWDAAAVVPYLSYLGTTNANYWYLTYDNPQSITAKVHYIIAQNLGGWIIWDLWADYLPGDSHPHPLLDAVQVGSAAAVLSASALGTGTVGTLYNAALRAGGAAPGQWSLSSGSLPRGLSMSSAGVISGTPTTAGTSSFVGTVENFGGSSSQSFTITIAASD
jgi:GH18 family chitinase